jgi:hypothetical protein
MNWKCELVGMRASVGWRLSGGFAPEETFSPLGLFISIKNDAFSASLLQYRSDASGSRSVVALSLRTELLPFSSGGRILRRSNSA